MHRMKGINSMITSIAAGGMDESLMIPTMSWVTPVKARSWPKTFEHAKINNSMAANFADSATASTSIPTLNCR